MVVAAAAVLVLAYAAGPRLKGLLKLGTRGSGGAPPYEQPLALRDQVARIDHALYGGLFRLGLSTEDVHFDRVERVKVGEQPFERASLRVELPRAVSFEAARKELYGSLQPLGKKLALSWKAKAANASLEVRWEGVLTHHLELERPEARARPRAAPLPEVALVMDDLGYDLGQTRRLIALGQPVTCSVLPHSPHGRETIELAREAGLECLAHLPMEARGLPARKLGEGALLMKMDAAELLRTLKGDLDSLPQVSGANNHMGSLLTTNEPRMKVVLAELKRRDLFFLDSRTTSHTLGRALAHRMGLKTTERDIFLDNVQDKGAIVTQLARLVGVARSQGRAVAICHPYPATFAALEAGLPELSRKVRLVTVSELVR